jgi:hypothetical protein
MRTYPRELNTNKHREPQNKGDKVQELEELV